MKLSEMIRKSQELLETVGDLEVLSSEYAICNVRVKEVTKQQQVEWEVPEGFKYIDVVLDN